MYYFKDNVNRWIGSRSHQSMPSKFAERVYFGPSIVRCRWFNYSGGGGLWSGLMTKVIYCLRLSLL